MEKSELLNTYQSLLDNRVQNNQLRTCVSHHPTDDPVVIQVEGKPVINFSSNDYLGLSRHSEVVAAGVRALEQYGSGTCSSRLITGSTHFGKELESTLAHWYQKEAALMFPSGYQTNVSVLQTLLDKDCLVFADKYNHASLLDGMLQSGCKWQRYTHCNLQHLETLLQKNDEHPHKWIITDSVFSMDGDYPDLRRLVKLAKQYNAKIYLDEAHGLGVFGEQFRSGLAEQFGVVQDIDIIMGTFSKAAGGSGGFVTASQTLIDYLVNFCRGFIYTTALPPASIASTLKAVELIQNNQTHQATLWKNIQFWNQHAGHLQQAESPIIPVYLGSGVNGVKKQEQLLNQGFWVHAIRPPTVPEGNQCLRVSLSCQHTEQQIIALIEAIKKVLRDDLA